MLGAALYLHSHQWIRTTMNYQSVVSPASGWVAPDITVQYLRFTTKLRPAIHDHSRAVDIRFA